MNQIIASLKGYVYGLSLPKIGVVDILEIIIIAFALYHEIGRASCRERV